MIVNNIEVQDIPGFSEYALSRCGKVWSKLRKDFIDRKIGGYWLKIGKHTFGYPQINLCSKGVHKTFQIHDLLLRTYKGPCPAGMECRHLDGNPKNNRLDNLKWGTRLENTFDALKHGTRVDNRGERCGTSKLCEEQVRVIFHAYHDGIAKLRELAQHFNLSEAAVSFIINKKRWSHLWEK